MFYQLFKNSCLNNVNRFTAVVTRIINKFKQLRLPKGASIDLVCPCNVQHHCGVGGPFDSFSLTFYLADMKYFHWGRGEHKIL